ncbi:MAG: hypothetical protein LBE13_13230 [Bacteroidales bacterium]|jgi:hypothetical protein|nr:hypothetical protein [Bacteroidales bacterium]
MKLFKIPATTFIEKIVITLFLILPLYLIVFSINFLYDNMKSPRVDWKLNNLPDESNRIYHPCGISIIAPNGWRHSFYIAKDEEDNNGLYLTSEISRRSQCMIKIFEYNTSSYPDKIKNDHAYKPIIFQNLPALEKLDIEKRSNGIESPSTITGERYFFRETHCYCVLYYFQFCDTVPVNLSLYLDSLQIDNKNYEDVNVH